MREWCQMLSPTMVNEILGVYHGEWMQQMDRCWYSDDGYSVTSRVLKTEWGKVEHVVITRLGKGSSDGSGDIPWKVKQEIKNELFGEEKLAIEVFPQESHLIDAMDVYHLWVFEKGFKLPFGIHPFKDPKNQWCKRGNLPAGPEEISKMKKFMERTKE